MTTSPRPSQVNGVAVPYGAPAAELQARCRQRGAGRWAAFVALAHGQDAASCDALVAACGDGDPHVRRAAVEALGQHALGRAAAATVLALLDDDDPVVLRSACRAAALLGLAEARPALHRLRGHGAATTRAAALTALGGLWRSEDFDALYAQAADDPDDEVRKQASWVLHERAAADHAARLFALWYDDPLPRHRTWACELAAGIDEPAVRARLLAMRDDADGHVRRAAERSAAGQS